MTELERPTPGSLPAEGRNDLPLPGAGHPSDSTESPLPAGGLPGRDLGYEPDSPEGDRRDELADRVEVGMPSPAGSTRPDVLPDVEPPELPM